MAIKAVFLALFTISCFTVLFLGQYINPSLNKITSPRRDVGEYTSDDWKHIPFGIDADTWALQHTNASDHKWLTRDTLNSVWQEKQVYTCSKDQPCSNGACCGEAGHCGFGPTYCGDGCTSNCDATAPCGQYSKDGKTTCPLNVCCSEFGFCGTTREFCGTGCQSNCRTPSSPGSNGDVRSSIIGYYESWKSAPLSGNNVCNRMEPSEIPVEGLTYLNLAFAYITPGTYDIIPMKDVSTDIIAKVADAKRSNPDAKVYVSLGGWDFSNNGTVYQSVFGDISSDLLKRFKFANKLHQFMVEYGFDGVDFDWEYPGAPDRGGTDADVVNYPLLLQAVKYKFQVESAPFGITITAPTSYWYLRWFDLPNLMKYADYINLMSYDLHGVWDQTSHIGPYVYAHTNLTEIDSALSLLWRNNVSPSQVNLGLAFYGRSYTLEDPTCWDPGCAFKAKGTAGYCTQTAGILSYEEIQDTLMSKEYFPIYDPVAGVNYMIFDEDQWVSFDDKTTFQQKIDFANERGLHGLLIWAIDLDDSSLTALKAVTGKDLEPSIKESDTLGHWDVSKCWITPCGTDCQDGFVKMTGLNLDSNGKGCPDSGKNPTQRSLCCPPWGAPDPATCSWHGSHPVCFGQCSPGGVMLAKDDYGGSGHCDNGLFKAFCCPATSGASAVAACSAERSSWTNPKCPSEQPQEIAKIGTNDGARPYCCPAEPTFSNCAWHGAGFTCSGNRCPIGQIEMARSKDGSGGLFSGCVLGRQAVLCCDPPYDGTAFLPVPLENLFPQDLPAEDKPEYYEAFDHSPNAVPSYESTYTDDPNKEPFAWTIMVGDEADVQSLRKRDGSHLEPFDCPNPSASDYSEQTIRAVCTVEGDDNNCEHIKIGSVAGTIIRLPEDCGPDEWVRVSSFRRVEDHPLPDHLTKRLHENPRVYEIKYDYNFRNLRRDGGEIYIRFDSSSHPGYWDSIVSSSPSGSIKRRSAQDWRGFHMEWFDQHKINKRGFSSSASWWRDRFDSLLSRNYNYGLQQVYPFSQNLYNAEKVCQPYGYASMNIDVEGHLKATLDFGLSLIGTLRNFDFSESYAYFHFSGLEVNATMTIDGEAGFRYESQVKQLLNRWNVWGGNYNIKGLWSIGPYFDATAQVRALATVSGRISTGLIMRTSNNQFTYMFPQSLERYPPADNINALVVAPKIQIGNGAAFASDGSLSVTVTPTVGFQIQLQALGSELVDTKISARFENTAILQVGTWNSDCEGAQYALGYTLEVGIDIENPLPGFDVGDLNYLVYRKTQALKEMTCYPWGEEPPHEERSINARSSGLTKRYTPAASTVGSLYTDIWADALTCAQNTHTTIGNCHASILDDNPKSESYSKRDVLIDDVEAGIDRRDLHLLSKRTSVKTSKFCGNILLQSRSFPNSGEMIRDANTYGFSTYGPKKPNKCDDYSFGKVPTPPAAESSQWATEHVLEWQLLSKFWAEEAKNRGLGPIFDNPRVKDTKSWKPKVTMCEYLKFWWDKKRFTINGITDYPAMIVASAFPGIGFHRDELVLLDAETNGIKERLWGKGDIRSSTTMRNYIRGVKVDDPDNSQYRDVNWAINSCKHVMLAMEYITTPEISTILVNQATRVAQYFDDVEDYLATYYDSNWNRRSYQKQGYAEAWKSFMYENWELQAIKATKFLDDWVPAIAEAYRSAEDGDLAMGGVETNDDLINRVIALTDAWNEFPRTFANPFPDSWE